MTDNEARNNKRPITPKRDEIYLARPDPETQGIKVKIRENIPFFDMALVMYLEDGKMFFEKKGQLALYPHSCLFAAEGDSSENKEQKDGQ